MNNKSLVIKIMIICILVIWVIAIGMNKKPKENDTNYKILTTFYPIYIMTLNITDGAQDVDISNMAEKNTGCIHDYTLNVEDMKKFEKTDVLVQNGKGLENFFGKIRNSYPEIKVIESAQNVEKLIEEEDEENAHVWLSIENYISQVQTISNQLQKLNKQNKEIYSRNTNKYIEELTTLKRKFENMIGISKKSAICLNEALAYLLEEVKIDATIIETDHENNTLSADKIKSIIDKMNRENIRIIFIEKADDTKIAETLAKETGAKIYKLDSAMHGESSKDAYIKSMEYNFNQLGRALLVDH